jgi:hypothetical protein
MRTKPGQMWENSDKVLMVEANGTPSTFNIAEFTSSDFSIIGASTVNEKDLENHLSSGLYMLSNKKLILK